MERNPGDLAGAQLEAAFRQILTQSGLCLDLLSVIQDVCLTVFDGFMGPVFDLLSVECGAQTGDRVNVISAFVQNAGDGRNSGKWGNGGEEERA